MYQLVEELKVTQQQEEQVAQNQFRKQIYHLHIKLKEQCTLLLLFIYGNTQDVPTRFLYVPTNLSWNSDLTKVSLKDLQITRSLIIIIQYVHIYNTKRPTDFTFVINIFWHLLTGKKSLIHINDQKHIVCDQILMFSYHRFLIFLGQS